MAAAGEALGRFDLEATITHLSAAVRAFTAADDPCGAAMASAQLGDTFSLMGNVAASRAWFARADRLVADLPPCLEQGWVAVAAMGCDVDDPAVLQERADLALDRARRFGDLELEAKALADGGLAHVQAGRLAEGMAQIDEAMALVCGPIERGDVAAKSVCSFFTACYHAVDVERFETWRVLLRERGVVGPEIGSAIFLSSHCDSVHAALLVELGRWGEAEELLVRATAEFEAVMPAVAWHPDIALADLRTRQGRCTDAEVLLLGKEQMVQALLPAARLHQARGDHDLALASAHRGLRVLGDDRLRAAELLAVALDVHLARGDLAAARTTFDDLATRTEGLPVPALAARTEVARARLLAAEGAHAAAAETAEGALDLLDARTHPWLRATVLADVARWHDRAGAPGPAREAASLVVKGLADLDVVVDPADRALLDRLVGAGDDPRPARLASLHRDGRWWTVSCAETSVRLADSKGLRYLAVLVEAPGTERHALDLVDRLEGLGEVSRRALGEPGPLLDSASRTAYRHRIEQLRTQIDDALECGQEERAEALQVEHDQLVQQLAQAFGIGGRPRAAGSAAEKARLNVTRALRSALARLVEALPEPGAILDRRVRTGLYCAYEPGDDDVVRWIVQS
jgi:tetratricopeptide (TPR) repeat protein